MNTTLTSKTSSFFEATFGQKPELLVLSPGRINLIGEHIDYNDGFVLPAAIDRYICFAFSKNNSNTSKIYAIDLKDSFEMNHQEPIKLQDKVWTNYIRGVLLQLQTENFALEGVNCVFSSTIPTGSGLSSSAALECGFLFGLNNLFQLQIDSKKIALMGQSAEHWVGIKCGIMDQFASVLGKENHFVKIDCTTLEHTYHPAKFENYSLVLLDSNVKHSLFTSEYNVRRQECEEGLKIITSNFPEITSFKNCSQNQLLSIKNQMTEKVFNRCFYVIKEIERVGKACIALDNGAIETLGQLLWETHDGLSKEYEVSCAELDWMVATLKKEDAVVGSRLMGGGFGGCTINLIKKGEEKRVEENLKALYLEEFNIELKTYHLKISNGTSVYEA